MSCSVDLQPPAIILLIIWATVKTMILLFQAVLVTLSVLRALISLII